MTEEKYKKGRVFLALNTKELFLYTAGVFTVFTIIFLVMITFGLVPETLRTTEPIVDISFDDEEERLEFVKNITEMEEKPETFTVPESISIPDIGVNSQIEHPTSQDIPTLDNALKKGAVYYPGSGSIEKGNVFLFGHSATAWSFVQNPAYKVFNGLEELEKGQEIVLEAKGYEYVYKVDRITLVDENTAFVNFKNTGNTLTISTCNTFGAKQDRWVVEATFSEKRAI